MGVIHYKTILITLHLSCINTATSLNEKWPIICSMSSGQINWFRADEILARPHLSIRPVFLDGCCSLCSPSAPLSPCFHLCRKTGFWQTGLSAVEENGLSWKLYHRLVTTVTSKSSHLLLWTQSPCRHTGVGLMKTSGLFICTSHLSSSCTRPPCLPTCPCSSVSASRPYFTSPELRPSSVLVLASLSVPLSVTHVFMPSVSDSFS